MSNNKKARKSLLNSRGFTLIEVVIVLAIGALIILVVLQAVSAAQRSQRDGTRKQEASRVTSLLETYASNNRGRYPASASAAATSLQAYDGDLIDKYVFQSANCPSGIDSGDYVMVYNANSTARSYTLDVCLEAGGQAVIIE